MSTFFQLCTLDEKINGVVTVIEVRPPHAGSLDNTQIAIGYSDGTVLVYDMVQQQSVTFAGNNNLYTPWI